MNLTLFFQYFYNKNPFHFRNYSYNKTKFKFCGFKTKNSNFCYEGDDLHYWMCQNNSREISFNRRGSKATVDFEKKLETVEFDGSKQTPDLLLKAVQETGDGKTYVVSNMKSEPVKN